MKKLIFLLPLTGLFNIVSAQFTAINQDTTNLLNAVVFLSKDTGYAVGQEWNGPGHGIILRTFDGGQTWDTSLISYFNYSSWLMCLAVPSANVAYTGGHDGSVFKTTDGGDTWSYASEVPGWENDCGDLFFLNDSTGFALDFHGSIHKTTDGAQSWGMVYYHPPSLSVSNNSWPNTGKFQFLNDTLGFVANGDSGHVLKTTDGGYSWFSIPVGNLSMKVNSICMLNKDTGFVVGDKGMMSKTINGGVSWQPVIQLATANKDLLDIDFFNDSVGYAVGGRDYYTGPTPSTYHALIFRTTDGGNTWYRDDSLCCNWLTAIDAVDDSVGYAVGWKGRILKNSNAGLTSVSYSLPAEDHLAVYPNPSSGTFYVVADSRVLLVEVMNILGEVISSEKYYDKRLTIDLKAQPKGIYLVMVSTEKGISTQKIIIE